MTTVIFTTEIFNYDNLTGHTMTVSTMYEKPGFFKTRVTLSTETHVFSVKEFIHGPNKNAAIAKHKRLITKYLSLQN